MFIASEFAVNALAPAAKRGIWVGIYSTSLALGFAAGPVILSLTGNEGSLPFAAGAVLFVIAGVPILAAGDKMPALAGRAKKSPLSFVGRVPALMSAAFVFGAIETSAMGLLPVHALRNGFTAQDGALFVAALAIGNVLFQIPLGLLSDRLPRAALLLAVSGIAAIGALILAGLPHSALFIPILVVWSGVASGLYMIGLTDLGARYGGNDLAAANAAFVSCYASGMVFGPPLVGRALDASPGAGLFLSLGFLAFLTLAIQLVRPLKGLLR